MHGLLTNINKNSGKKIKFGPPPPGPLRAIFSFFLKILKVTLQTRAPKIFASVDGGRVEGLACADPGARTPIGASGIF